MRPSRSSAFTLRQEGDATLIDITPARASATFVSAPVLLGGLFGLPSLGVLLNPARYDALSLSAAACGLSVVALAAWALWRSVGGRRRRQLRLDSAGLTTEAGLLPWPTIGERRAETPEPHHHHPAPGIHALAANIARQQQATQWSLSQHRRDGQPALLLATGLDAPTATALRDALDSAAQRHAQ